MESHYLLLVNRTNSTLASLPLARQLREAGLEWRPREGDRFQPFGLEGTKKLSDLLREKRVPAADRPGVLLVADEDGILWVVGVARAERTRILPTSERIVTISVAERADHPKQGT